MTKSKRGFASLSPERMKEIARKGGLAVARKENHMAIIGKTGGNKVAQNKEHMATIGKKGGKATQERRKARTVQVTII